MDVLETFKPENSKVDKHLATHRDLGSLIIRWEEWSMLEHGGTYTPCTLQ